MSISEIAKPLPTRVERFETVIVGAGQAGLAAGYHLAAHDIDFTILTDEARVGDNWRKRWDSLRLFTPARYSGLPGMPFPAVPSHLADKDEVGDYLERYAERFDLPVRRETRVQELTYNGDHFVLRSDRYPCVIEAENVIVATGAFQRPRIPNVSRRLSPRILQLHSSEYRNPFELPDGPVLVVGAGNSGAQIALELSQSREVWLAGRDTGHLPRRLLGRDIFDWLWPVMKRATADTRLGQRMRASIRASGDALIGIPERQLREAGVTRVGRLDDERGSFPLFGDQEVEPSVIVWCTGFAPDYRWIDLPVFQSDGLPRHTRGAVTEAPGLFFLGLRFQHRLNSSLIGGAGADAAYIAALIAQRSEALVGA